MSLTIHLMRHGATPAESPWRFLGQRDVPLSREGRAQALWWRKALAHVEYAQAWCSGLERSRETARLLVGEGGVRVRDCPAFREISLGAWDGLTVEEVRARYPGQYEARGADIAGFRPPGAESFEDVAGRAWPALERIAAGHTGTGDATILIVAHAGVNRVLLCRLLGMPLAGLFSLGQEPGCLNSIMFSKGPPVLSSLNLLPPAVASS